jgi:hypothetical protein
MYRSICICLLITTIINKRIDVENLLIQNLVMIPKLIVYAVLFRILKNAKIIIAYLENYLCNSQNIEANM